MFTLNIREIVAVGKSEMKWKLLSGSDSTDSQQEVPKANTGEDTKALVKAAENPAASEKLKNGVDTTLTANHNAQAALAGPLPASPNPLAKKPILKASAEDKDNNARQAEAFMESLKLLASTDPVAKVLLNRFTAGAGNDGDAYVDLSRLNMGSMIKWIARGMPMGTNGLTPVGYTSNGMDNGETKGLQKIAETLNTSGDKDKITNFSKKIASFYDAAQTTEDFLLAAHNSQDTTPYNKEAFVASLSEYRSGTSYTLDTNGRVESKDRSFFTPYAPGELSSALKGLSESDLLSRVNSILKIGGVASTATTLAGLADTMKKDPAVRAAYIKGLNIVAFSNDRSAFFRTGKFEAGLNTDTSKKLIEKMQTPEMQAAVKAGIDSTATTDKKAVSADPKLNDAQKKSITEKIDRVVAELSAPDKLTALSIDAAMAMTNERIGAGVSIGKELDSVLADSGALTASLSKAFGGKMGGLIALSFTKEIFASESAELGVHYGVSYASKLVPFLGVHGRYEDVLAAITMSPVGVNVYTGIRLGTNRDQDARLQKEIAKSTEAISGLTKAKSIDAIDLKGIVTNTDIAESMTKNLRVLLTENKYDPASPDLIKETVMKSAIMEVMNIEIINISRQKNDMGWVLDQAGINFGQLAGLAYILPGFRVARTDMFTGITQHTSRQKVGETIKAIDKNTLFSAPTMVAGTNTYSVEFKKGEVNKGAIVLPPGAAWDTSSDGKSTTISGLKDYGLKVTLQDGKYKVEYDTTKPITQTKGTDGEKAIDVTTVTTGSLDRIKSIGEALSNAEVRKALSHLWVNTARNSQANVFAQSLENLNAGSSIESAKQAFITLITKPVLLREFRGLHAAISKMNTADLRSALFDIRGAMMMDENQANKSTRLKDGTIVVNESLADTQKRFNAMVANPKMQALLKQMGISASDYVGMIVGSDNKITLGAPQASIMGAIASLKTSDVYMARMPAGTVRFAQSGAQSFIKDVSATATIVQRGAMFDTILSPNSLDAMNLRSNIAKTLSTTVDKVAFENLRGLMVNGTTTINGRTISMAGQQFGLCAYGDCTNPGITMQAGSISAPAIPGQPGVASADISVNEVTQQYQDATTYKTATGTRNIGVSFAAGVEQKDPITKVPEKKEPDTKTEIPGTTETGYRTVIEVRDVKVSPNNIQTINGNKVIVIDIGGTKTNISLSSLTRDQAIALTKGQSITITTSVNVSQPYTITTPGTTIITPGKVTPGYEVPNHNPLSDSNNSVNAAVLSAVTDKDIWNQPGSAQWSYDASKYPTDAAYIDYLIKTGFPFKN